MKEEPASRSLSRRTLLERVIQGLGVTFALGHGNRRGCDETACCPMVGGVASAMLLTLIVIPAIYVIWRW